MIFEVVLAAVLAAAAYVLYVTIAIPLMFRRRMRAQGIPAMPFVPFQGLLREKRRFEGMEMPLEDREVPRAKVGRVYVTEVAWFPRLGVIDPVTAQDILVRKAAAFEKPAILKETAKSFLGRGLVLSDGETHRRQRMMINPAFHFKHMSSMVALMDPERLLRMRWGAAIDAAGGSAIEVDVPAAMGDVTLHIICAAAFGTDSTTDTEAMDKVRFAVTDGISTSSWRFSHLLAQTPIVRSLPLASKRTVDKMSADLRDVVTQIADRRRSGETSSNLPDGGRDLLDLMLEGRDENGDPMPNDLLLDELQTFVLAGHETTSSVLSWILHELTLHPEIFARVRAEADRLLGGGTATYAQLKEMEYTKAVVREGLRLHSPVVIVVREATRDVELRRSDGAPFTLPAGYSAFIGIRTIHRDPELWPDPRKFDPERHMGGKRPVHPQAYVPFVAGPRGCVGLNFAELEAVAVLARVARDYDIEEVPGQKVLPISRLTLGFMYGLRIRVRRRRR